MGEQRNIYIVSPVILVLFKKLAVKSLNIYAMTKTRYAIEFGPPRKIQFHYPTVFFQPIGAEPRQSDSLPGRLVASNQQVVQPHRRKA